MKKFLLSSGFLLVLFSGVAQNDKAGAQNFFKSLVKAYFDKDCKKFYAAYNDTMIRIDPNEEKLFTCQQLIQDSMACREMENVTKPLGSYTQYIKDYKIIVLNRKEFTTPNNSTIARKVYAEGTDNVYVYEVLQFINRFYTDNDYLVFGNTHKQDTRRNIKSNFFWMIVRKTAKGWRISGAGN